MKITNNEENVIIQPRAAPLTHLAQPRKRFTFVYDWRSVAVVAAVISLAVIIAYWQPWVATSPANTSIHVADSASDPITPQNRRSGGEQLPPFAASQQAIARDKAQAQLSVFVEKQIHLEETLRVQAWGEVEYQAALAAAKEGDAAFVQDQFDQALDAYDNANQLLDRVLTIADEQFNEHLSDARSAIDNLDVDRAALAVAAAKRIKPDHADSLKLEQRVRTLPEVTKLLRTATNHELSGRIDAALGAYQAVKALDPATSSLADRLQQVAQQEQKQMIAGLISQGFAHLDVDRFDAARNAFKQVVALEPGNDIALGGLQQVQAEYDINQIKQLHREAQAALGDEQWQAAIDAFTSIQDLDDKIQFAVTGISNARAHLRSHTLLSKIVEQPQRLSSEKLFFEAQNILSESESLTHQGDELTRLIGETQHLLDVYRNPVDVVLLSDNATDIVVSNVGHLGFFDEKVLSLRPGTYTIRGSQNGCRDLYLSIEILPGIEPLDLSCQERPAISQ